MIGEYFGCWASWLVFSKVFVGEKYGVCGGMDGTMNSLEEGDRIGGRDGRDEVKGGGRCGVGAL